MWTNNAPTPAPARSTRPVVIEPMIGTRRARINKGYAVCDPGAAQAADEGRSIYFGETLTTFQVPPTQSKLSLRAIIVPDP